MEQHKYGDIINGFEYLPKEQRKKILLISDDLRMPSGVGTMSREMVLGTAHHFNWAQIGGAIQHPDYGKQVDISEAVNKEIGISDASISVYPMHGYGTIDIVRQIAEREQVHAIMPYTDPRFFPWLFNNEHELRLKYALLFYHVWDDLPFPRYNEQFYESCDWISCISKQTYNIVKNVWRNNPPKPWQVSYVPHGINAELFYPIDIHNQKTFEVPSGKTYKNEKNEDVMELINKTDFEILSETKKSLFGDRETEFVLLYVNRNVRRKMTSDVILAYNAFCNGLKPEDAEKCVLVMHTQPVDDAGTHLPEMVKQMGIKHRVVFSEARIEPKYMNMIFNLADVTINIASNEGFGLGTAESLMAGTPIIVNTTGGLQDQVGFMKEDGTYLTVNDFNANWGSNHDGKYRKHGEWALPIFPSTLSMQGSIPTPYIFDDRCRYQDAAKAIWYWYDLTKEERKRRGALGREFMLNTDVGMSTTEMCRRFMEGIDTTFANWKPRKRFSLYKVEEKTFPDDTMGVSGNIVDANKFGE